MILSLSGVSYGYGTATILRGVTFHVEEGDRVGVVGVNGSGKTTLLSLISGDLTPDGGTVSVSRDRTIGILHQNDTFNVDSSVKDTVLEQMYATFPHLLRQEGRLREIESALKEETDGAKLEKLSAEFASLNAKFIDGGGLYFRSRCRSMLKGLGFGEEYHSLPISSLSGGQRTRLALAKILAAEPDIMLLDEPTNHLDTDTLLWLEEHLSSYKKSLLVVSHDRYFLDRVTNKTLDVENGSVTMYGVPYSGFVEEKKKNKDNYRKKYELQQKEIARLEAFIENQRKWNRERNIIAAESRMKAIDRMEKLERPAADPKKISFSIDSPGSSGNDVLEARELTMGFPEKTLFENLSFLLKKGDRMFISGPNGCGKSTLLRILMGELEPLSGTVVTGYNVRIGYYSQDNQGLDPDSTVLEEIWSAYPGLTQTKIRDTLAQFLFRGEDVEKKVAVLSGGERARLTLAKLILSKINLLILDEPTNHLDIDSREALEEALTGFDGTLICVSHDRYFVRRLATRFILLRDGRWRDVISTYDKLTESDSLPAAAKSAGAENGVKVSDQKSEYLARKQEAQALRRAARRLEAVEAEAAKLEAEIANIDDELYGEAAADYLRACELTDKKTVAEDRLMQLYGEEDELRAVLGDHDNSKSQEV
ncbi:MAG: ABC-F type ribosomal protection protein [Clostridia bacterium]|nr:ABC-F type ribosomal protection protein [Clostridia bacterium]